MTTITLAVLGGVPLHRDVMLHVPGGPAFSVETFFDNHRRPRGRLRPPDAPSFSRVTPQITNTASPRARADTATAINEAQRHQCELEGLPEMLFCRFHALLRLLWLSCRLRRLSLWLSPLVSSAE